MIARLLICGLYCLSLSFFVSTVCSAQDEVNDEFVNMIIEFIKDEDKSMRASGFEQVRTEVKGAAATKRFAALLPELNPEVQANLLRALSDRGDQAALPAVITILDSEADPTVREVAVLALGYLGEPGDIPRLVKIYVEGSDKEKKAARASLVRLQGEEVPKTIVAQMTKATPQVQAALIEILQERRALETIPDMLSAAQGDNMLVRYTAMLALADLAKPDHIPEMVQAVLNTERGRERDSAEKAIRSVLFQVKDPVIRAEPLLAAYNELNNEDKKTMLSTFGRIGGPDALKIVQGAINSKDSSLHSLGIRALCNWPDASVVPQLIELATTDAHPDHKRTALRALIRIAPLKEDGKGNIRSDAERLEMLKKAMSMATTDAEKKFVLDRARTIVSLDALHFIKPYLDQRPHVQQACLSIVELGHYRNLREPNKTEFDKLLERVKQLSTDEVVKLRAGLYQEEKTWERPARPKAKPPEPAKPKPAPVKSITKPQEKHEVAPDAEAASPIMVIVVICVLLLACAAMVAMKKRADSDK